MEWRGDPNRSQQVDGEWLASFAVMRCVEFHGLEYPQAEMVGELHFLAEHFRHESGCSLFLPLLPARPSSIQRLAPHSVEVGRGMLVNLLSKAVGL